MATDLRSRTAAVILPLLTLAFIAAGAVSGARRDEVWLAGLVITGAPVAWQTVRLMFRGHFATDVVAMLAILTAIPLREPLAGLIVVLMQTGGEALERYAEGRASRAVRLLEEDAPRIAHRLEGTEITDIPVDDIRVGDSLLLRPGEMVPCDAVVVDGRSRVDTSRITGEPEPLSASAGVLLRSGTLNMQGALVLRSEALARDSQYARIVDLVRSAESSKAPLQRLADRYAVWFTPITLAVCAVAWLVSGDPTRALAVLVVATPCPLILATPVAIIGGINRAASRQVIVRTGGALERLDRVHVAVFDKTGTLTIGKPQVASIVPAPSRRFETPELLRLAAAVEQYSGHQLARPVVDAATIAGLSIPAATGIEEKPGEGVLGTADGHLVAVGSRRFIERHSQSEIAPQQSESLRASIAIDGVFAGSIDYADALRPGVSVMLSRLAELGVRRTILLSGDDVMHTARVARALGLAEAEGGLLPDEKLERVSALAHEGRGVLMVGDGTNDAPALARADVGIALAGHGGGITAEAADVVILNDDLSRVPEAIAIGQRTMRIARQSIWTGLALSAIAVVFAATGRIAPVAGAVIQEIIDVAVIVNALRASGSGRGRWQELQRPVQGTADNGVGSGPHTASAEV
jgi:heavy metal translocating P-type ATPase